MCVESRSFRERLEQALIAYQNRSIQTAQIIAQLIDLAKEMQAARRRGEDLGLTEEELAFYDALETNDSAVQVLGDEQLRAIARELVKTVRANVTIDWTVRENVRANLRVLVKRLLRRYGYPPESRRRRRRRCWSRRSCGARSGLLETQIQHIYSMICGFHYKNSQCSIPRPHRCSTAVKRRAEKSEKLPLKQGKRERIAALPCKIQAGEKIYSVVSIFGCQHTARIQALFI